MARFTKLQLRTIKDRHIFTSAEPQAMINSLKSEVHNLRIIALPKPF